MVPWVLTPSPAPAGRAPPLSQDSLKRRAAKLTAALNSLEVRVRATGVLCPSALPTSVKALTRPRPPPSSQGVTCNTAEGAMYCFPRLEMPEKAIQAAEKMGKPVDFMYCLRLLESTGVTVVPGSGFGQARGTWHFRTTFLPPESDMDGVVEAITRFHKQFMDEYR